MGAAVAVILIKERHIVEAMERAGATTPARAMTVDEIGADAHGVGWRRLRERVVVRETTPGSGRFYVDLEVWRAGRRMRQRLALVIAILVLIAIVGGLFGVWRLR